MLPYGWIPGWRPPGNIEPKEENPPSGIDKDKKCLHCGWELKYIGVTPAGVECTNPNCGGGWYKPPNRDHIGPFDENYDGWGYD